MTLFTPTPPQLSIIRQPSGPLFRFFGLTPGAATRTGPAATPRQCAIARAAVREVLG